MINEFIAKTILTIKFYKLNKIHKTKICVRNAILSLIYIKQSIIMLITKLYKNYIFWWKKLKNDII